MYIKSKVSVHFHTICHSVFDCGVSFSSPSFMMVLGAKYCYQTSEWLQFNLLIFCITVFSCYHLNSVLACLWLVPDPSYSRNWGPCIGMWRLKGLSHVNRSSLYMYVYFNRCIVSMVRIKFSNWCLMLGPRYFHIYWNRT